MQALTHQFPAVCYYGKDAADDSLCTDPALPAWVTVHAKNGGHHFEGGYQPLAARRGEELPAMHWMPVYASPDAGHAETLNRLRVLRGGAGRA